MLGSGNGGSTKNLGQSRIWPEFVWFCGDGISGGWRGLLYKKLKEGAGNGMAERNKVFVFLSGHGRYQALGMSKC